MSLAKQLRGDINLKPVFIIAKSRVISALTRFVLQDNIFRLTVHAAPAAKHILKTSSATKVLILD
ncbi:MAG: hypothetical protein H7061_10265 [Bdellovibrionaceae bacterium]|nr:hypothetical protein [Bdellovibrio sp.]